MGEELATYEPSLSDGTIDTDFSVFEVLLARNVFFPYRYSQEYIWLEVLAADIAQAVELAGQWVLVADNSFENTGLARPGSTHPEHTRIGDWTLPVRWDMAVEESLAAFSEVRHPQTGIRIGFLAPDNFQEALDEMATPGRCRLLLKKPTRTALPVCLIPAVSRPL